MACSAAHAAAPGWSSPQMLKGRMCEYIGLFGVAGGAYEADSEQRQQRTVPAAALRPGRSPNTLQDPRAELVGFGRRFRRIPPASEMKPFTRGPLWGLVRENLQLALEGTGIAPAPVQSLMGTYLSYLVSAGIGAGPHRPCGRCPHAAGACRSKWVILSFQHGAGRPT
jgi:hypothetical protein